MSANVRHLVQIDAFTSTPFAGNPAAVTVLDAYPEDQVMQAVASEMNLSETAFLVRHPDETDAYFLRWFTPAAEVDLCGHATLASAHHVFEARLVPRTSTVRFFTASGVLSVFSSEGGLTMDFPAEPPTALDEVSLLAGVVPPGWSFAGQNRMDLFVAYDDPATVLELSPDLSRVAALPARGLIVTAPAVAADGRRAVARRAPKADFISRFFAPALGVPEDPVTGSAHCALAPYWVGQLGRDPLRGFQASPRGGEVQVSVRGDRVMLTGSAVTIMRAELVV